MITTLGQIGSLKEIADFVSAASQWSPWLVIAGILMYYMRQQGSNDKTRNENIKSLIETIGVIKVDGDKTRTEMQEIAEETRQNTEVIQVFSQSNQGVQATLVKLDDTVQKFDKSMQIISDTYVQTTNDHNASVQAYGERLIGRMDVTKLDIIGKVDAVPAAVVDKLTPRLDEHQTGLNAVLTLLQDQVALLIKERNEAIHRAERAEKRIADLQAVNAGISTDPDPTSPLAGAILEQKLSFVDGNVNRTIAGVPDPDKPPTPPAGAVDAETGEERKVA